MKNIEYFLPYKADRSAMLNKHWFSIMTPEYYETQLFKILKEKEEGLVYWRRCQFYRTYNDYSYSSYDMRWLNRRKYLTQWPSLRHPIRCYTSNTRCYALKNNTKNIMVKN
jgi:hypothetical protein